MAEDNDQERTEEASPRRLEQAREEGHVARSQELTTFAMMAAAGGGLWWLGGQVFGRLMAVVRDGMRFDGAGVFDPAQMTTRMHAQAFEALLAIARMAICGWRLTSRYPLSTSTASNRPGTRLSTRYSSSTMIRSRVASSYAPASQRSWAKASPHLA